MSECGLSSLPRDKIPSDILTALEARGIQAEAEASVALDKGIGGTRVEPVFETFQKISRWSRDVIITEKIDGTNGVIHISEEGCVTAGSRNRWLYPPQSDNFGFAKWVAENEDELRTILGPGRHFGEWWGRGIQRGYGLREKRFSLFNVQRWHDTRLVAEGKSLVVGSNSQGQGGLVWVVPVLYWGPLMPHAVDDVLFTLRGSSFAVQDYYPNPEGIVIYHTASKTLFKKTLKGDEKGKEE